MTFPHELLVRSSFAKAMPLRGVATCSSKLPGNGLSQTTNNNHLWTGNRLSRLLSNKINDDSSMVPPPLEWRQKQLLDLERKHSKIPLTEETDIRTIHSDDELQPMWKAMESRVKHRKARTIHENKGKMGRANIKKTDEDYWLREGLYLEDEAKNGGGK